MRVQLDEVGVQRPGGETYGTLMVASRVRAVRVWSDRALSRLSVLALTDRGRLRRSSLVTASSHVPQPAVIARSGWGADESLRFDSNGKEIWPPTFWPIQKLIVHHTATQNNDPDPAATIRSIYYYHAVTQGWGDIGYNFLIDEAGNVYEGRHSRDFAFGEAPTGEDLSGNGVTGAHAQGYNSGTVGIALLGTLTNKDATPQARSALERLLAWKAERHGIDPLGSSLYTNPVSGTKATFPNIAGHRDVGATDCPGSVFYATLPAIRSDVAALVAPDTTAPSRPSGLMASASDRKVTLDWADNSEPDIAAYRVYRQNQDGSWPTSPVATTTSSSFSDTGLSDGTTYTYRVTAVDTSENESEPSQSASATPPGYVFPIGASPLRTSIVPAFKACETTAADSRHGWPLDFSSCHAPVPASSTVTIGSSSIGFMRIMVCDAGSNSGFCSVPGGAMPKPDARLTGSIRDVRCRASLPAGCVSGTDYDPDTTSGPYASTGNGTDIGAQQACFPGTRSDAVCSAGTDITWTAELPEATTGATGTQFEGQGIRITDTDNGSSHDGGATVTNLAFPIPVDCIATIDPAVGSTCGSNTTANALVPGVVTSGKTAVWQVGEIELKDSGPDGVRGNSDDEVFAVQGIFIP